MMVSTPMSITTKNYQFILIGSNPFKNIISSEINY